MLPRVALVYLCWNNLRHLSAVVESWAASDYPKDRVTIVILPAHSPDGIADVIMRDVLPRSGKDLPEIVFLNEENRGFATNTNVGLQWALANNFDYAYLQNGDMRLDTHTLTAAVEVAQRDQKIGSVQSLVCMWHDTNVVNASGGTMHVAGYGYARDNGTPRSKIVVEDGEEIAYASGAAVLYRCSALREVGLLDEGFFMYHEDLELGLRLRIAGFKNVLAANSLGYHDYTFGRNKKMFAWMELYRWIVVLAYLRVRTLFLIAPLLVAIEIGTWAMALMGGWASAKAWAYGQWFLPRTWRFLFRMRRRAQRFRVITDAELTRLWTGKIDAQQKANSIVDRFANPIVDGIWRTLKRCIVW